MSSMTYDTGDRRKLSVEIYDEDNDPVDPAILVFKLVEPDGEVTTYDYGTDSELIRTGVGTYHVYWDCAKTGFHQWRYEASGNVIIAEQSTFAVRPASV